MRFIRARNEEQKQIRIEQIITAAVKIYETTPLDKITMASIAKQLEFTRGNIYKYVTSKEEIFLLLISRDFAEFVDEVTQSFENIDKMSIEEFAGKWTETLCRHKRLMELFSVLYTMIEKNVSLENLTSFKKQLYTGIHKLEPLFHKVLPNIDQKQIMSILMMQLYYAIGLYPSTLLSDLQKEAIRLSGMPYQLEDFPTSYTRFTIVLLNGYCAMCK